MNEQLNRIEDMMSQLLKMVGENNIKLHEMIEKSEEHAERLDRIDERFDWIDERFDKLEAKVDQVEVKLDENTYQIAICNDRLTRVERKVD